MALSIAGCSDRFSATIPTVPVVPPPPRPDDGVDSQLDIPHPLFGGLSDMVAGDGVVRLSWIPANDDDTPSEEIRYRVYLASGPGDEDFENPTLETDPGITSVEFPGLPNGETVFAVVRAIDLNGNEDPNSVEWFALPNPVRYIRAGAPGGGDGLSPDTPFSALGQALGAAFNLGGVNFWIAEGGYPENIVLFQGMSAYGGFTADFDLAKRDPVTRGTQFATAFTTTPLVTMNPTSSIALSSTTAIAIDGLILNGNNLAPRGIFAEDCLVRISRCNLFNMLGKGIELRSDFVNDVIVEGFVRGNSVQNVSAEGIFIAAITDVSIDNNLIMNIGTEGLETQWIHASSTIDARLDITRNTIEDCGDEGIDLDFAEVNPLDSATSQGARMRAFVRNNRVENCALQGIQIDLDFQNSDGIDFRARIEDNEIRANGLEGILLDGDSRGSFRVARNSIVGNGGAGIYLTGTADGPYARILNNRILGNGGGIFAEGAATIEVRHTLLRANRGAALSVDRAVMTCTNSILMENLIASSPTSLGYSLLFSEPIPNVNDESNQIGDPLLENHPTLITFASGVGTAGVIPIGSTTGWEIGDQVEVRDDGVLRTITKTTLSSVIVEPPVDVLNGDLVMNWLDSTSAKEAEGLLAGSPAIDSGDPLERDRNGTLPDLGPIGGDTPGNVGIETAIPLESASLELVEIDPAPSELQVGDVWSLRFNRDISIEIEDSVFVTSGGEELTGLSVITVGERTIKLDLFAADLIPGETIEIEVIPSTTMIGSTELLQATHIIYNALVGAWVHDSDLGVNDSNGLISTSQPISVPVRFDGQIDFAGDTDIVRIDLEAGQTIQAELMVAQLESPLISSMTLFAEDGVTVLSESMALGPFYFDPVLPLYTAGTAQTLYLRIQSSEPILGPVGDYRLLVR